VIRGSREVLSGSATLNTLPKEGFYVIQIGTNLAEGFKSKQRSSTFLAVVFGRSIYQGRERDLYPSEYDPEMIKDEILAS
jgi:hypothetical protein